MLMGKLIGNERCRTFKPINLSISTFFFSLSLCSLNSTCRTAFTERTFEDLSFLGFLVTSTHCKFFYWSAKIGYHRNSSKMLVVRCDRRDKQRKRRGLVAKKFSSMILVL